VWSPFHFRGCFAVLLENIVLPLFNNQAKGKGGGVDTGGVRGGNAYASTCGEEKGQEGRVSPWCKFSLSNLVGSQLCHDNPYFSFAWTSVVVATPHVGQMFSHVATSTVMAQCV
jgi:hypothetical protein